MSVLDKLRIPTEIADESDGFEPEFAKEDGDNFRGESESIPTDNPFRDPAPGEPLVTSRAKTEPRQRTEPPRVTKKHKEEAQEEIETFLNALALAWGWQAPPCGEALEQAAPDIAAKVTKLVARNPRWLQRVREGGVLADALGIAVAFKPVVHTAWGFYTQPKEETGGVVFDPDKFPAYTG